MTLPPGERANHSVWGAEKGTFEIWFFVVFDPGSNRAFWIRYEATHLLEQGPASRAGMVWASAFERSGGGATPSVVSAKRIVPLEDCEIARDRFHVRIGEARLSPGRLTGEVGSGAGRIAWSLTYEPAARPSIRSPAWLDRVPLPMHGVHPNTEVPFSGWVEVGSLRHELSSARGTQEHLFGKERPDEIRWVYATGLDGDPAAYFELAQVRPRKALPALVFASMSTPRASVDATALRSVPRARVVAGNGWLSGRAEGGDRSIIVAAHAARDSFAGYVYRDPRGHDLYVAQSDLAHVEVEVFEKAPLGRRRPIHRTIAPVGALELHQPTPLEGIRYLPWPSETPAEAPDAEPEVGGAVAPPPLPKDGELLPLPVPTRMFAAGLTYADHVTETGSGAEPVMFEKSVRAWLGDGELVTRPDDASVRDALDAVEPGLGSALLDRWGFIPALLDYEVEIGLYLLADIEPRDLASQDRSPSVGYFVANDLTHRTCQILGEGSRDPMAFWSASKSFPGFCPVTKTMWLPSRPSLDSLPEVTLSTFVRGERRQQARSTALAVPVRALLSAAMKRAGRGLRAGEVVLTGTPSGIALKVPAWKRALGRRFLDRFARAEAAFGLYASAPEAFLTAGAVVTVEAGFLGRRTIVVA